MVSNGEEEWKDGAHHQHGQLWLGEAAVVILAQAGHLAHGKYSSGGGGAMATFGEHKH